MVWQFCAFFLKWVKKGNFSILENGLTNEVPLAPRQQIVGAEKSHQLLAPFLLLLLLLLLLLGNKKIGLTAAEHSIIIIWLCSEHFLYRKLLFYCMKGYLHYVRTSSQQAVRNTKKLKFTKVLWCVCTCVRVMSKAQAKNEWNGSTNFRILIIWIFPRFC